MVAATIASWFVQPTELLYNMIKHPMGHVTRDQPTLFSSVFIKKTA